jgi:dolichol kinase
VLTFLSDAAGATLVLTLVGWVFAVSGQLRRSGVEPELTRKAAHLFSALAVLPVPWLLETPAGYLGLALIAAAVVWAMRRSGKLGFLDDVERSRVTEYCYVAALAVLAFVSQGDRRLWLAPVLVLGISDAAAAVIGKRFGRHRYTVLGATRSLEGSAACALSAFIIVALVTKDLRAAALTGLAVAAVEAVTPSGFDNFTVPVTAWLALRGLPPALLHALALIAPVAAAGLVHHAVRRFDLLSALRIPLHDALFGRNKTLRGFIVMPLVCGAFYAFILTPAAGVLIGFAYVIAELPNSYLKRRLGIAPGQASGPLFRVLDHLDSALGCALAFALLRQPATVVVTGLVAAPLIHVAVNQVSCALKLRSSPW